MLTKSKKLDRDGFTIIEVMIVLAIAGLILLVVLLAVPALQRNARNTTMRTDTSAIAAGLAEFSSNNDGAQPNAAGSSKVANDPKLILNATTGAGAAASSKTATNVKIQASDLVTFLTQDIATANAGSPGTIVVDFGTTCDNAVYAGTLTAPTLKIQTKSARATAIISTEEVAGGLKMRCLDA